MSGVAVAALTGGAWWYYAHERAEQDEIARRELTTVADGRAKLIENWRHERIGDGRKLGSSATMAIARRVLASPTIGKQDEADILDILRRVAEESQYSDAMLVHADGSVAVRLHTDRMESAELRRAVRAELARAAIRAQEATLNDLARETRDGRPLMTLAVPVGDAGAYLLDVDPTRFLYPLLESWPGSSRTAESLLVKLQGKEVVYLSPRRLEGAGALLTRRPVPEVERPSGARMDGGWSLKTKDHRGVAILVRVRRVAGSQWLLVSKVDLAEVRSPMGRLLLDLLLLTALISVTTVALIRQARKAQQARIEREREAWFYTVANDTPAYLWMASADLKNSFLNRPLREFLGRGEASLPRSVRAYLHPEDSKAARKLFLDSMSARHGFRHEIRLRRSDGVYRWAVNEAVPRFSEKGEFLGFAGALLDITDRKLAEEQLRAANAALSAELAETVRKEREIETLSARLIDAQEEERARLARELHDDLSQQIAALSIAMGNLKRQIPADRAEARAQSDRIHLRLVQVAESVRRMSHELHPAVLEYSGLAAALRGYCEEFGMLTGVRVALKIEGQHEDLPRAAALCLYRVAQEALRNVAKHAQVRAAELELTRPEGAVELVISDRGVGMDVTEAVRAKGLGLVSIKERTRLVNGRVEIRSAPNEGTTITVTIPAAAADEKTRTMTV